MSKKAALFWKWCQFLQVQLNCLLISVWIFLVNYYLIELIKESTFIFKTLELIQAFFFHRHKNKIYHTFHHTTIPPIAIHIHIFTSKLVQCSHGSLFYIKSTDCSHQMKTLQKKYFIAYCLQCSPLPKKTNHLPASWS